MKNSHYPEPGDHSERYYEGEPRERKHKPKYIIYDPKQLDQIAHIETLLQTVGAERRRVHKELDDLEKNLGRRFLSGEDTDALMGDLHDLEDAHRLLGAAYNFLVWQLEAVKRGGALNRV